MLTDDEYGYSCAGRACQGTIRTMIEGARRTSPRRKLAKRIAAAAVATAIAGFAAVKFADIWRGEPYPVADPTVTAHRLDVQTQAVYDALALPPSAGLDPRWPGEGITADTLECHLRGLGHLLENMNDSPPSEPYTSDIGDSWALGGVTRPQAQDALERARQTLTRAGWTILSYDNGNAQQLQLRLRPPAAARATEGDTVSVALYPGDRLAVSASADCARYPDGTSADAEGKPESLPAPAAPVQLRHR